MKPKDYPLKPEEEAQASCPPASAQIRPSVGVHICELIFGYNKATLTISKRGLGHHGRGWDTTNDTHLCVFTAVIQFSSQILLMLG